MKKQLWITLLACACCTTTAWAGEAGTVLKSDAIKAAPFSDAKDVGAIRRGDTVDILKRQGGWYQVSSAKGNGWVRMLSVRKGEARKANEVTGLAGLASGRAGTGKVVATTGVRGLSEEELKAAQFNESEVNNMEAQTVSKDDARRFAAQGKLKSSRFDYLAKP